MKVHDIVLEAVIKTIPKKKKCKKAKWLSEEALQISEEKREAKGKGEKEIYIHLNAEFQRIARGDKKASKFGKLSSGRRTGKGQFSFQSQRKAKWLSEEALQIAEKRREAKGKEEKEKYTHLNAEFQRIARKDKKAFLSNQCKETE